VNGAIPRTECDRVLDDVKAKPSGWPTASLDPDSGRGPRATSGMPATRKTHKIRSLRFQGIAGSTLPWVCGWFALPFFWVIRSAASRYSKAFFPPPNRAV